MKQCYHETQKLQSVVMKWHCYDRDALMYTCQISRLFQSGLNFEAIPKNLSPSKFYQNLGQTDFFLKTSYSLYRKKNLHAFNYCIL